jgi:ABC-type polysaccharide/polyol phosphate export permease
MSWMERESMLNGLLVNLVSGLVVMFISGILYYRKPERKWLLILLVIGILSVITAGIRMLLA